MADVITRLKVESSEYDSKIKRATQSLNEMTTAAEREGSKIATANKENIALAQSLGKMATVSTTAKGKMSELSAAIEAATIQYNRLSAAEKQGQFGRALNASIGRLQTRLAGLKTEMAAVQTSMGKINVGSLGGGMGIGAQFGQGLKSAAMMFGPAALAIGGVTAAIGGMKKVVGDMVSLNMQFEQSSANLAAVMGKSRDEVTALTTQAKQLGATTQWTAIQILDLQTNLARLGFNQTEILNSTSAVQKLATATQADLGPAAELAGATLRAFGLNATEMERVTSVLAVSTTKSALSFDKLATALPIIAPVAKQAGFSLEDTVSMLGKLSDAGLDASMSANSLKNIFIRMANDSGKLAKALGGPVTDADSLAKALVKLRSEGMSLNDMFQMTGQRAVTAFGVLTEGAEDVAKLSTEITGCEDALDKMVKEQLETLEGQTKLFNSAWEGLMLSFSNSTGVISSVVGAFTKLLEAYTKWRNRNAGGDTAIQTYKVSEDSIKSQAKTKLGLLRGDVASGKGNKWFSGEKMSDDAILEQVNAENAALNKQIETLKKLEQEYQQYKSDLKTAQNSGDTAKAVSLMEKNPLRGTDYIGKSDVVGNIYKDIAAAKDKLRVNEYITSALTPATAVTETKGKGGGGLGGTEKDLTSKSRAKIEAQMQKDIADLDKVDKIKLGKEQEYEDEVFAIKLAAYDRIKKLYAEDSKEYSQMEAKIAQLTIQHQGTTLRLANKGKSSAPKPKEEKLLNYSQEGISNLGSQIKSAMSKSEIGSQGYLLAADQLLDFTTFENLLKAATERGVQPDPEWMASLFEDIKIGADVAPETWQALVDSLNEQIAAANNELPTIKLDVKTGGIEAAEKDMDKLSENVQGAIGAFGQLGGAIQQIDDPAAQVAGIIMQAVANVAASFAKSLLGAVGPWDWIAAAIGGVSTMISTIAAIKSATAGSYAEGGIVPGNSYSGDNLTANVNSGELILSRAQSDSIASQLQGGATQTVVVEGRISGKDILLSANNTNRAAGGSRGYYANVH